MREPITRDNIREAFLCMFDEGYTLSEVKQIAEVAHSEWWHERNREFESA